MFYQMLNSRGSKSFNCYTYTDFYYPPHFHKHLEIAYVISGEITACVNNSNFTVNKGQFLLIPPYHIHSYSTSFSSVVWVGVFTNDYVNEFISLINGKTADRFAYAHL